MVTTRLGLNLDALDTICEEIHEANVRAGWWSNLETGEPKERNEGEMLMLMVSELAEAMEAHRKNLMDDKLPHLHGYPVEMVDLFIRWADRMGKYRKDTGMSVAQICMQKLLFNEQREDHKIENRKGENGKKY